jgi:hypothetical protein
MTEVPADFVIRKGRRRKPWLLVGLTAVIGFLVAAVGLVALRSPFNQAQYDQIELGMTLDEVTAILGRPPGYYWVSPEEKFVNMRDKGTIAFGTKDYEEIERKLAVYDIVSRDTGQSVATLRKYVSDQNGVFLLTREDKVIGAMYVVSLTSFNRGAWLDRLRRKLGL